MFNYIKKRLENNHFINHIGIELISIEKNEVVIGIEIKPHHLQQNGFMHGGVTATLCDVVTGIAAYTQAKENKNVVTADLKISYLHPSTSKKVIAKGMVVKSGNFLAFCEGKVYDIFENEEKLIATCSSIMCFVDIPVV